jgi:acetylornithine deacetylase/succinyl-diaminopimelate desuccinylase-like protein
MRRINLLSAAAALLAGLPCLQAQGVPSRTSRLADQVRAHVATHQQSIVRELADLVSTPNIAADHEDIRRNAEQLQSMLARRGFNGEILETPRNPLVYGELRVPGATRTLLLYAHYDGQPVDASQWKQPSPFTPVMRTARLQDGGTEVPNWQSLDRYQPDWRLYGRSTADDKSPIVAILAAVDALKASGLQPTSNIRVILDGEEEASSPSLAPAIGRYRDKLSADIVLVCDGPIHSSGRPTVAFGARGIVTADLTVYGPKVGVHSGNYGNWIANPALRLAHLVASMKDDNGKVLVAGFYDGLPPLTAEEQSMIASVPEDSVKLLSTFGVAQPELPGRSLQQGFQLPTLNLRGLVSGHVGAGARTIIPGQATAALDIRLVKETRAADMQAKLEAHIRRQGYELLRGAPDDAARAKFARIASLVWTDTPTEAFRTSPSDPQARAVVASIASAYGQPPVQIRTLGGTVPIAPFVDALGAPALLIPIVNFDNNQHEENENLRLGNLFDGIVTIAAVLRM